MSENKKAIILSELIRKSWYSHDNPCWNEIANDVLEAGYRKVPELTLITLEELEKEIRNKINTGFPCYRDIFNKQCEYTTGCENCPDYFNYIVDIMSSIMPSIKSYVLSQVEKARKEEQERIADYILKVGGKCPNVPCPNDTNDYEKGVKEVSCRQCWIEALKGEATE